MSISETVASPLETGVRTYHGRATGRRAHRRLVVALALIAGDLVAAFVVGIFSKLSAGAVPFTEFGDFLGNVSLPVQSVILIFAALGLYEGYGPSPPERLRLRILGVVAYGICCLLLSKELSPRVIGELSITSVLLILLGFYGETAIRQILIRGGSWGAPTVIIGADETAQALARSLAEQPELGLRPIGFIVDSTLDTSCSTERLPILGHLDDVPSSTIEVAVYSSCSDLERHEINRIGSLPFPRIVLAQQIHDLQGMWVQIRPLGSAIGLEITRELYRPRNLRLKRILDSILATLGLLLAAPVIAVLAVAIRIIDAGSPFYVQTRVGQGGRQIRVLKLRTMYLDADRRLQDHLDACPEAKAEWLRFFKLSNDPRVLPGIGHLIRRKSLDELPQLWNVVRGEMSLVGPRPFPAYHLDGFDPAFRALRTSVPPGLTGLWQISARSDGDLIVQRSQDTYYIRNWSLWLDVYILLATVPAVFAGKGAR